MAEAQSRVLAWILSGGFLVCVWCSQDCWCILRGLLYRESCQGVRQVHAQVEKGVTKCQTVSELVGVCDCEFGVESDAGL